MLATGYIQSNVEDGRLSKSLLSVHLLEIGGSLEGLTSLVLSAKCCMSPVRILLFKITSLDTVFKS